MITPLAPDQPDVSTFGGTLVNADNVVDAESELDATYWNRLIAQVLGLSGPSPKAVVFVSNPGGVPSNPPQFHSNWGAGPTGAPTVTVAAGVYTITFPTTVADLQATPETHALNLLGATVIPIDSNFYLGSVGTVTANVVTCAFFSPGGGAAKFAPGRFLLVVW